MAVHAWVDEDKYIGINMQPFSWNHLNAIKAEVAGSRFLKSRKIHRAPLTMATCRALRRAVGDDLVVHENLRAWAWEQVRKAERFGTLNDARDAELHRITGDFGDGFVLRGYQRAAVRFLADAQGVMIADDMGLGKTVEAVAGLLEAGMGAGAHLVVAPLSTLTNPWADTITQLTGHSVHVLPTGKAARERTVATCLAMARAGKPFWLVMNPAAVRLRSEFGGHEHDANTATRRKCAKDRMGCTEKLVQVLPDLERIGWNAIIVDECHDGSIRNPDTLTSKALHRLRTSKKVSLSGTPMTAKPTDLWGTLNWLDPVTFSSKWSFYDAFFEVQRDEVYVKGGRGAKRKTATVGTLRKDREEEFYEMLKPYMIRRSKREVAAELPEKQYVHHWVTLSQAQQKQYDAMQDDAEARLGARKRLTAKIKLEEYLRLRQFCDAVCDWQDDKVVMTDDSAKLDKVIEILDELGIIAGDGDAQVVIASDFTEAVNMISRRLNKLKVSHYAITGKVTGSERTRVVQEFQEGKVRVMLLNTRAGGTGITLDAADDMIMFDENWSPARNEQVEDRIHRISRIHRATIHYIRARGTVEEYIMNRVSEIGSEFWRMLDSNRDLGIKF